MQSLGQLWPKTALDVVVDTQIALNHIRELSDDLIGVLVEQSLQFGHFLVIVEILLILSVKLNENGFEVFQSLDELLGTLLLRQVRSLLELAVFLLQSVVELGQFDLHIVLDIFLLISDNLENLIFKLLLALNLQLFEFVKHGVHKWSQNLHVLR